MANGDESFADRFQTVAPLSLQCCSNFHCSSAVERFTGRRRRAHWIRVLPASAWSIWSASISTQRDGWWVQRGQRFHVSHSLFVRSLLLRVASYTFVWLGQVTTMNETISNGTFDRRKTKFDRLLKRLRLRNASSYVLEGSVGLRLYQSGEARAKQLPIMKLLSLFV